MRKSGKIAIKILQQEKKIEKEIVTNSPEILVVDDNTINQKISLRFLSKLNCKVTLKSNGQEALEEMKMKKYDLVFMDCQMPVMDGFESTKQIRLWEESLGINSPESVSKHRNIIVALTGNAYEEDKQRCFNSGMDDYLCKPVTQALLLEKLKKHGVFK